MTVETFECLMPPSQRDWPSVRLIPDLFCRLHQAVGRKSILLAVDGISIAAAERAWSSCEMDRLRSVLPTTSAVAWLSILTGADSCTHLVPGLYFRVERAPHPINVAATQPSDPWASELIPEVHTVFQRLQAMDVQSVACIGALTQFPGPWREALFRGATQVPSARFQRLQPDPELAVSAAIADVDDVLARRKNAPGTVFAYVDLDTAIHQRGYDSRVIGALQSLGAAAQNWAHDGHIVLAVSDHGLVPVTPSATAMAAWHDLASSSLCVGSGGAGRMRWLHAQKDHGVDLLEAAKLAIGDWAAVHAASDFALCEELRGRIGEVIAVARSPDFPLPACRSGWEHGANTEEELGVPLTLWGPKDGPSLAEAVDEIVHEG